MVIISEQTSSITRLFFYTCEVCGKKKRKPSNRITRQTDGKIIDICSNCLSEEIHCLIFNTPAIEKATIQIG